MLMASEVSVSNGIIGNETMLGCCEDAPTARMSC
jgi:hypothetical protein